MRLPRVVPIVVLCAVALAASSCSDDGGSSDGGSSGTDGTTTAAVPLEGTNWVLTDQSDLGVPLGDVAVTAHFTSDTVSGSSGCNGYEMGIARDGSKLEVVSTGMSTQMSCGTSTDRVERAYRAALQKVRTYAISGEELTLSNLGGESVLVYRAGGVNDIVGDWVATSYYSGDAIQSVAVGTTITATFTKDSVSGNGGCNQYSGPATIDRTTIRIGPLAGTLRACADPAVDTQEQHYLAALDLARTYEVKGNRLTLFRQGGTIAASFERG